MEPKIRVGIIGANVNRGWGTTAHIPALLALPEFELTAVCTAHPETAEAARQKFGAKLAFHDYHEMINHPNIDIVSIVVRVPYHHQLTMDTLRAGKNVYTEWPLGATLKEAQEMADLARAQGVQTMVGLQGRCSPGYLRMKELIEEGYVGQVLACQLTAFGAGVLDRTSDRAWSKDREGGVGPLPVTFGHGIDALCLAAGEFTEVSSVVATQVPQWRLTDTNQMVDVTAPDNVLVSGRLASGAVVSAHVASIPVHGSDLTIRIFGREGTLMHQGSQLAAPRLMGGQAKDKAMEELPIPDRLRWVPEGVPQGPPYNVAQMYRRFGEAIRTGTPVEPNFDTAVKRHQLLAAVEASSAQGKRVPIE